MPHKVKRPTPPASTESKAGPAASKPSESKADPLPASPNEADGGTDEERAAAKKAAANKKKKDKKKAKAAAAKAAAAAATGGAGGAGAAPEQKAEPVAPVAADVAGDDEWELVEEAKPLAKTTHGNTALHVAAALGNIDDVVRVLDEQVRSVFMGCVRAVRQQCVCVCKVDLMGGAVVRARSCVWAPSDAA